MNYVNPWLTLMSFVYFIAFGFISFTASRRLVEVYIEKVESRFLKSLEPLVGSVIFCGIFGLSLIILYNILT